MNVDYRMGEDAIAEARVFNKTRVEVEARRFVEPGEGGGGGTEGAFFTMRTVTDAVDPEDNGDIYLQGGMVSGGTGNVVIPEFKLYDASTTTWVGSPSPGDTLIITASGTGQVTSGILDPIWNLDDADLTLDPIAPNTLPTASSAGTGKLCHILIGSYFEGGFSPSAPGNFNITFCWGGYTVTRS